MPGDSPLAVRKTNLGMPGAARLSQSSSAPALLPSASGDDLKRQVWIDLPASPQQASPAWESEADCTSPLSVPKSLSRPGTASIASRSGSRCHSRRGASGRFSGRLTPEEQNCFRRVKTPSGLCEAKSEVYFTTATGMLRRAAAEDSWNTLPVLKGKFYSVPGLSESMCGPKMRASTPSGLLERRSDRKLENEDLTTTILEEIFPRQLPKREGSRPAPLDDFDGSSPPTGSAGSPSAALSVMLSPTRRSSGSGTGMVAFQTTGAPELKRGTSQMLVGKTLALPAARSSMTCTGEFHVAPSPSRQALQGGRSSVMLDFRTSLLEKFSTIQESCESLARDAPSERAMARNEFRRVITKQGFEWSNKEKDLIFAELDFQGAGHITISDMHIALEAAAHVRSVEDLRRRWLASGYNSMTSAVRKAEQIVGIDMDERMSYDDFCRALKGVNVLESHEHQALFAAVCSDRGNHPKVSLQELLAAVATVSPDLLLEDCRARIMKAYKSVDQAYWEIDKDKGGTITANEFFEKAAYRLGLAEKEAKKAFRQIDLDGNGEITREEFVTALRIAEPSLSLEDLRLKIRRSFRSILEALREQFADPLTQEIEDQIKVELPRLVTIFLPLDFKESETRTLFELVDIHKEGEKTVLDIVKGIHYFAPACALEDLRARCIQSSTHVADAFVKLGTTQRTKLRDLENFAQELHSLNLIDAAEADTALSMSRKTASGSGAKDGVTLLFSGDVIIRKVFDLLDVSHEGQISMSRVMAALQSCGAGSKVRLPPQERDEQATREVKDHLGPKYRLANDLKHQVRLGALYEEKESRGAAATDAAGAAVAGVAGGGQESTGTGSRCGSPAGRERPKVRAATSPGMLRRGGSGRLDSSSPERPVSPYRNGADYASMKSAPRLRTTPIVDLVDYMASDTYNMMRLQGPDPGKPSQMTVQHAQDSWGTVWQDLHSCTPPDVAIRKKIEGGLHSYFQSAAMSMSHDVPLLAGVSQSSMDQYKKMRAHKAALRM